MTSVQLSFISTYHLDLPESHHAIFLLLVLMTKSVLSWTRRLSWMTSVNIQLSPNWICIYLDNGMWVGCKIRGICLSGGIVVRNLPVNAEDERDSGSIPGSGSAHGGGNGNPFQYSCLENSMDRGVSGATVHGVTKSQTQLSLHTCSIYFWSSHWRPQVPSIAVCLDMPFSRLCALTDRNGVD